MQAVDGYHGGYDDDTFDLAIMSHVIEHLEFPRQLLYEAARVARYVFVEVPLEDTVRLPRDFAFDAVGHINVYSPKTIRRLVQSCGLRVLREMTTNPPKEASEYREGCIGAAKYLVKGSLLRALPRVATGLLTYHQALICQRSAG